MRIAFVGRGRGGKTTCAAVFARFLAARGRPVVAVDATPDRRLGAVLGLGDPPAACPWLAERLAGSRRQFVDFDALRSGPSPMTTEGVRLLVPEAVVPLLDRLADGAGEYVVVDLPSDASASARVDLTVLVSEPTRRTVELYRQHRERAAAEGAELRVLGNKISDWGDAAWLTEQVGDALLGCVGHSAWVRAAERGAAPTVDGLEPGNTAAMAAVRAALDACRPDLDTTQGGTAPMEPCRPGVERAYSASRR